MFSGFETDEEIFLNACRRLDRFFIFNKPGLEKPDNFFFSV